ncbi:SPFH domain-containing protein [Solibacillus sp. CAU 1738]|uniref:SPFH domain-containing protein n=1 Tax=Solibacillus sp. CAU 1738 TaxID=3140363 RepID=UPI00326103CB
MSILNRIKFDGLQSRDWIIFKYPSESIVLGSTLVVNEGQVALFVKGGQVFDAFPAGTYVLSTYNLPLLGSIVNFVYGGKTPFTAEIFFINLTSKLDLYWGTSDPIQLIDPKYFVKLRIRAFGQLALRIDDYMLFFREIIGGMNKNEIVQYEKVHDYFRGMLVTYIKTELANKIIRDKISALEISTELQNLSLSLKKLVTEEFDHYGFSLMNFHIQSINFPDEDFEQINDILADRAKFEIMGDNRYVTQRSFDVYETAANNQSGVAGALFAGGVGIGAGQLMADSMHQQVQPMTNNSNHMICPSCHGNISSNSKFCSLCGTTIVKTTIPCSSCQTENQENSKFCSGCGKNLQKPICTCGTELSLDSKFCHNCGVKTN